MKSIGVRITNYRTAEDSGEFTVEPDVTCLVGKNESGKTVSLRAMTRINPVEPGLTFDEVLDFPARLTSRRKQWKSDKRIPAVTATFEFSDDEMATIGADLGVGALKTPIFTVTCGYRVRAKTFDLDVNEAAIVTHLRAGLDIAPSAAVSVNAAATIAQLLDALENLDEPPAAVTTLAERIRSWRDRQVSLHIIDEYAAPWMPKFVYFAEYDAMPGKVSIPDLIVRRDTDELTRGERALLSLLNMAAVKPEDFHHTDQHERLIRELENAGNVISDEVFKYWSQNDELEVQLKVLPVEDDAIAPFDQGPILEVRVYNRRHRASVNFGERSSGFVWFFSFLAYFTELEDAADTELILLLDEPGLSLHGRAQADLLTLIDERLAPKHQVIYTTHSPFMVSAHHLHRVRTVIDHEKDGTTISAEIFKADSDTAFPLLAAMGIEMTQTLFIGEHTLLLEGPSDLIYLDVFTDALESRGRTGLDTRWVKTPIGGAGKLSTFVTLLGANKLNVAVIIDSSTKNTQAVKQLRQNGQLGRHALVEVSEFTGTGDSDIEDLFEVDFYLDLVNRAYADELPAPLTQADLTSKDPRITRRIDAYFAANRIANGKLNHYRSAAVLLRDQADLLPKIAELTLEYAEKLFSRLNSLLPEIKSRAADAARSADIRHVS